MKPEPITYVGPKLVVELHGVSLPHASTFLTGLPKPIQELVEKNDDIASLFVPTSKAVECLELAKIKGTKLNKASAAAFAWRPGRK